MIGCHTHEWWYVAANAHTVRTWRIAAVVCVSATNCHSVSAPMQGATKGVLTRSAVVSRVKSNLGETETNFDWLKALQLAINNFIA